jgi:uncharacterized 2Fe-2S/4Fe-4S cluster protein (DUF4445 family)
MSVLVRPGDRRFEVRPGQSVLEALTEGGLGLASYCGGRGICGKCVIRVLSGTPPEPDPEEQRYLSRRDFPSGSRLACRLFPVSDLVIELPEHLLTEQELDYDKADAESVPMTDPFPAGHNSEGQVYGAAVDIGTTTLSVRLIDLSSGRIVSGLTRFNPQVRFGADVVSRLSLAYKNPIKAAELRSVLTGGIDRLITDASRTAGINPASVRMISAAGNTAMTHLLLGLDIDRLAVYPFETDHLNFPAVPAGQSGFRISANAELFLAPGIRSFVGGDISAGLHALDLFRPAGNILFMDLGTNGEIVVATPAAILAASTAAGPAFEAANISCGLPAVPGAVFRADWNGESFDTATIAEARPATGICGTGLFDVISGALRAGLLSPDGQLSVPILRVTDDVALIPQDIRQFQLALAAVKAGVKILLEKAGLGFSLLDRVIVAGSFGSRLSKSGILGTGLLPESVSDRLEFPGNTSLKGAALLLGSRSARADLAVLTARVGHIPLASDERFQDFYIDALEFKPLI